MPLILTLSAQWVIELQDMKELSNLTWPLPKQTHEHQGQENIAVHPETMLGRKTSISLLEHKFLISSRHKVHS